MPQLRFFTLHDISKMNLKRHIIHKILSTAITLAALLFATPGAAAFDVDVYAASSVLNSGKWVKISVAETGIHLISDAQLRSWGFSDPAKVKVYGYGGQRIPDAMTLGNYTDDLPMVQSVKTSRGIFFYAQGPVNWVNAQSSRFIPAQNPFSTLGYYFLSDRDADAADLPLTSKGVATEAPATSFTEATFHETNLSSPGTTGHYLVGEDFRYTPSNTFTFDLDDRVEGTKVWAQVNFFAKTKNPSRLLFTVNGTQLEQTYDDNIKGCDVTSSYIHGTEAIIRKEFDISGNKLSLNLTHSSPSSTVLTANLDLIAVNYTRALKLSDGKLLFSLYNPAFTLSGASSETHIWDVTDPLKISQIATTADGNAVSCVNQYTGLRKYAAWNESASFPSPEFVENVANQDIHASETPDMVIFTISDWKDQAQRIADFHTQADGMKVAVIDQRQVFNEFSSGVPDVNGFRRLLKMYWDRGNANGSPLRYALFMGRGVFDNRRITSAINQLPYPTMPIWQTDNGYDDNSSYTTDDILAFLADNAGTSLASDMLCIAVGRFPVTSAENARELVDKLLEYNQAMAAGEWRNKIMMVADDEDNGIHLIQSENMLTWMAYSSPGSGNFFINKVYLDAYTRTAEGYPEARNAMFRQLNEGVTWWNYIGHASDHGWTHEKFLTMDDINDLYLRRYPVLFASTCDFLRWDRSSQSGAEALFNNNAGGVIAAISSTRPVYISDNGLLSLAISRYMVRRNASGQLPTLGQIYANAKNDIRPVSEDRNTGEPILGDRVANSNKLRYVLMGDPAMKLVAPSNIVKLHKINGKPIDPDNPPTLMARQEATVEGSVYGPDGSSVLTDFNGTVAISLYDAEHSVTTLGNGNGVAMVYDEQGNKLLSTSGAVTGGRFSIKIIMPSEIDDNFRPAAINMAATADDNRSAIGCERSIYAYGSDPNAATDSIAPVIESFVLNHPSFLSGDKVNASPMVLAKITDNRAINISTAGVGHQMTLCLDGSTTFTDVSSFFSVSGDSQSEGDIAYQLESLQPGFHTLKLRVWDTSGNFAESSIDFTVDNEVSPKIYDVYSDANPASVEANFYISHDRPDAKATVTITVYNLLGAEVWSASATGRSDMFKSAPVKWNLCDYAGRRVGRGIYLYRAAITTDNEHYETAAKRIAVTGN